MPTLSVVIPTVPGREALLQRSLDSVKAQVYSPFEIVVVMNGPVATGWFSDLSDPQIRLVHTVSQAGPAQARNMGGAVAGGEILAFLDDDDYWKENYLLEVMAVFEKSSSTDFVVGTLSQLVGSRETPFKSFGSTTQMSPPAVLQMLLRRNPGVTGSTISLRRNLFLSLGGFDTRLVPAEDKGLAITHLLNAGSIVHCSRAVAVIDNSERADRAARSYSLAISPILIAVRFWRWANFPTLVLLVVKSSKLVMQEFARSLKKASRGLASPRTFHYKSEG